LSPLTGLGRLKAGALAGAGLLAPLAAHAQDPGPILDRADSAYRAAHALAADFVQIVTNPLVGAPDTTRGRLVQVQPNDFEMRFTHPPGDRIVADGRYLWLYTPSTTPGQVIRTAIPATGTTGPNLIGQFVDHARARYTAQYLRADTLARDSVADLIALVPREQDLPYQRAVLWVSRSDGLLRRLDIVEAGGQERSVILSRLTVNEPPPAGAFVFSVPRHVRIVEQ